MTCETVYLIEGRTDVRLECCIAKKEAEMCNGSRDALLVCPGGAYSFLAEKEGEPCAKPFLAEGFNTFVLYYSLGEAARFPAPLQELSRAIAHLKENAGRYNINPDRIFVCGFSAGGHLAASLGTLWYREDAAFPGMKYGENKPCGMILGYPVITMGKYAHELCRERVCGKNAAESELNSYSLENQVTEKTVPCFMWQTEDDNCVPVQNSLLFASALADKGIPTEYHMYPSGPHGLAIATAETACGNPAGDNAHIAHWVRDCIEWTKMI